MGLFRGFKAKFTKDSSAKSAVKEAKKSDVVCVGYRVYSEFSDPPNFIPPQLPETRRVPAAIKTVPHRPETNISGSANIATVPVTPPTETYIITNPKIKKSSKKKSPEISESLSLSTIGANAENTNTHEISLIEVRNNKGKNNSESSSTYVVGKTSSFNPLANDNSSSKTLPPTSRTNNKTFEKKDPPKSILKTKSNIEVTPQTTYDEEIYDVQKMTSENSSKSSGYSSVSTEPASTSRTTNGEMHGLESSNHESSYYAGYSAQSTRIANTSSFAANIFFGGDDEPEIEIQRPRRTNTADEEDTESKNSIEC